MPNERTLCATACSPDALTIAASGSLAAERLTLTGTVTDTLGKPLEDATVMIYHTGVRQGYSTYCPSCYADCGKRAITDRAGSFTMFTIKSLDANLRFELLVVRDGYTAFFVERADPAQGSATAVLKPRAVVDDPARIVRGLVIDAHGRALRDAVVLLQGVETVLGMCLHGTPKGVDPLAVTNAIGEFELAYKEKAKGMLLQAEARGMAIKLIAVPTGTERQTIMVSEGALIRGRLVHQGKPVAGAEIGLIAQDTGGFTGNLKILGNPYREVRIGTQADGLFVIPNVPAPVAWYFYGTMESTAALGATEHLKCATTRDGDDVNVGDIQVRPGHRFRGQSDAERWCVHDGGDARNPHLRWPSRRQSDRIDVNDSHGRFAFTALATGDHSIFPSVRGYTMRAGRFRDCHGTSSARASPTRNNEPVTKMASSRAAPPASASAARISAATWMSPWSASSRMDSGRSARACAGAVAITCAARGNRIAAISSTALSRIAP
jgi:hypothetical protein